MKQERKLPTLLGGKPYQNGTGAPSSQQEDEIKKDVKQIGKDVKELLKETKKGTKAFVSVEKILKKAEEDKNQSKQKIDVEEKQKHFTTPAQQTQKNELVNETSNVKQKDPNQLELDFDVDGPDRRKKGKGLGRGGAGGGMARAAGAVGRAAMAAAPVAAVATIASLPYAGAAIEKRKIDENPDAPGLEFNPYAMEKRGEVSTQGHAGRLNARRAAGAVRWGEINDAVNSKLTDTELMEQYGRDREGLKKWLDENKDGKEFYDKNTKAPAVEDRQKLLGRTSEPMPDMGPPRELFEQKRAEVNQAADYKAAGETMSDAGYETVTGRMAMKPGPKQMQPADYEQAQQAQAAREATQRGLQQRKRGGTGREEEPVPARPDTVEPSPGAVQVTPAPSSDSGAAGQTPSSDSSQSKNTFWESMVRSYEPGFTPVSQLERLLPGIEDEFIKLAKSTSPRSSSVMSAHAHERKLIAMAKQNMEKKSTPTSEPDAKAAGGLVVSPNEEKNSNFYGDGGLIKGPGGAKTDSIAAYNKDTGRPIALSNNEYIMPANVTKEVGKNVLDAIVQDPRSLKRADGGDTEGKVKDYFQLKAQVDSLKSLRDDGGRNTLVDIDQKTLQAQEIFIKKLDDMKSELLRSGYSSEFLNDTSEKPASVLGSRTSKYSDELMSSSSQNKDLSGEMSAGGQVQPIVIQNNNSTNTQTAVPIKAEPRMQSSFTRYNDSRAAY